MNAFEAYVKAADLMRIVEDIPRDTDVITVLSFALVCIYANEITDKNELTKTGTPQVDKLMHYLADLNKNGELNQVVQIILYIMQ